MKLWSQHKSSHGAERTHARESEQPREPALGGGGVRGASRKAHGRVDGDLIVKSRLYKLLKRGTRAVTRGRRLNRSLKLVKRGGGSEAIGSFIKGGEVLSNTRWWRGAG
jgi:hypothetical protein